MHKGYIIIGDVHNESHLLGHAIDYALLNELRMVFVGDLVDYGPTPAETIHMAYNLMNNHNAIFIEGNHDNKINRYLLGNDVTISHGMVPTIEALKNNKVSDMFKSIYENMLPLLVIGDTHITHGAFTSSYWSDDIDVKKHDRARLYGEIDKSKPFVEWNGQQYPARTYAWVDAIPNNKVVIVGHDRSPFEEIPAFESNINQIVSKTNEQGGTVYFTDTGAGKGGFVSGVVVDNDGLVQNSVEFK